MKFLFILFFVSCASFVGKDYPEPSALSQLASQSDYNVFFKLIEFNFIENSYSHDSKSEDFIEMKKLTEVAIRAGLAQSTSFHINDFESENTDILIDISIKRVFSASTFWKYTSAATLYILPRRTAERVLIGIKYFDKDRRLIGMTEHEDTLIRWMSFFFIPLYPFTDSYDQAYKKLIRRVIRNSLIEAHKKDYFQYNT